MLIYTGYEIHKFNHRKGEIFGWTTFVEHRYVFFEEEIAVVVPAVAVGLILLEN